MFLNPIVFMLLGFILGYFVDAHVLAVISIVCVIIAVAFTLTRRETATDDPAVFWICSILGMIVMWVTWYVSSDQHAVRDFLSSLLFRAVYQH